MLVKVMAKTGMPGGNGVYRCKQCYQVTVINHTEMQFTEVGLMRLSLNLQR